MSFHHSPKIVTDGLVLCLDAANTKSYPGSGTTWSDLSGNGNTGTLTNGPTFDSGNKGSISFDGSNDTIQIPNSTSLTYTANESNSVEYWIAHGNPAGGLNAIFSKGSFTLGHTHLTVSNQLLIYTEASGTTVELNTGTIFSGLQNIWTHIVVTFNNGLISAYRNGILFSSVSGKVFSANSNTLWLGSNGNSQYFLTGKLSGFKLYKKSLTASEILQNYNATKGRFGL